jgi:integrase
VVANVASLRWSEIDTEAKTITLPKERTKNKTQHVVPLSDLSLSEIEKIPHRADRDLVFGEGKGGYSGWSRSKERLDRRLKPEKPWTLHDIRRTVRTGLGGLGVSPFTAEAILNHLPPKLIRTYAVTGDENETSFGKKL